MKLRFAKLAILALLGQGIAQDTTGIKPCASGCVSGVFANANSMGCALNDLVCVCGKNLDFTDGIRDCVNQACPAEDRAAQLPIAQSYGADQCKAASSSAGLLPSATPAPTPASVASQPTQPTEQAAASTPSTAATEASVEATASPVPTSSPASPTAAEPSDSAFSAASVDSSVSSSTSAVVESSPAPAPTSPASSQTLSATPSEQSSTSDGAATSAETASAETSNDDSPTTGSGGLPVAARAGIGAGVGVAVVLAAILAFCLISRRRKQKQAAAAARAPTMQISQPLPGSGRQYADNVRQAEPALSKTFTPSPQSSRSVPRAVSPTAAPPSPSASYSSELDAHTQRYEDLLPRTQPHDMI
ncbi:hypothetical protein F5Y05DRAFT_415471 [Hypoxylon sp. FL0543]|nr:hypothetical protein F5Y05DRAFT_415471 [Hypoxylon sp. FL0543]